MCKIPGFPIQVNEKLKLSWHPNFSGNLARKQYYLCEQAERLAKNLTLFQENGILPCFRKVIGKNDFPYQFKKIIVRYKKIGYNIDVCDRLHAWLVIQSRLTALPTSLIARR